MRAACSSGHLMMLALLLLVTWAGAMVPSMSARLGVCRRVYPLMLQEEISSDVLAETQAQLTEAICACAEAEAKSARLERQLLALGSTPWSVSDAGADTVEVARRVEQQLHAVQRSGQALVAADEPSFAPWLEDLSAVFDTIDDNGDGILTREEFRMGYALLRDEEIMAVFNAIDNNGDGVLTKDEFTQGYALLINNEEARARAQREATAREVAREVDAERVRTTKAAGLALAEAELMDVLFPVGNQQNRARPSPSRQGARARGGRLPGNLMPYTLYGLVPEGFDLEKAQRLVYARVRSKAAREFEQADLLQRKLSAMGVRLDDRWRTFSIGQSGEQQTEGEMSKPARPPGRGRGGARSGQRGKYARGRGRRPLASKLAAAAAAAATATTTG